MWDCSEGCLEPGCSGQRVSCPSSAFPALWEGLCHPSAAEAAVGVKDGHCSGETCSTSRM